MSITATVEDGKIVIPKDVQWPSGTVVRIEPVEEQVPTLFEAVQEFDGMAGDLPPTSPPISTISFTATPGDERRLCRCFLFRGTAEPARSASREVLSSRVIFAPAF